MRFVTITGADDAVDVRDLAALSREFPFVEWGILASLTSAGTPRYPSDRWLAELCRRGHHLNLAMHLCGRMARETLAGDNTWVDGWSVFRRVQINGYVPPAPEFAAVAAREPYEFILQVSSEEWLQETATEVAGLPNVGLLFDPSGGRGREPGRWAVPPFGVRMGYAGGIGPDNVEQVLRDIGPVNADAWIDMETGVRDERDRLSLDKVQLVLESVAPSFQQAAGTLPEVEQ